MKKIAERYLGSLCAALAAMLATCGIAWGSYNPGATTSTLQGAYTGGDTILEASGVPVTINNTTNSASGLPNVQVTKSPSTLKAGDGISIVMDSNTLGNGLSVSCGATSGQTGIHVANGVGGRGIAVDTTGGNATGVFIQAGIGTAFSTQNLGPGSGGMTSTAPGLQVQQTWNAVGTTFTALRVDVTDTAASVASTVIKQTRNNSTLAFATNTAGVVTTYNSTDTAANGIAAIVGYGRLTGQSSGQSSVATFTVGAADGSFRVAANVNLTAFTVGTFTTTCIYTDEGNTSRTATLPFTSLSGTIGTAITTTTGPYEGVPIHIRAKAGTTVTIGTTGTFTTLTYNVEGTIERLQ